ncbi:hypothetical protein LCGC14_0608530 [marine sediment metagenome]|uniref:NAD(+) ADP-ribosyltransferase n=1 Tax=marine sediment metagenome TaxID=412755 RepID=A0A0F9R8J5_9ZZZZ
MANVIEHRKFSKTDLDANNNKFWYVWFYDDDQIETQNGRQGAMGQRRFITATGRKKYEAKLNEKRRKGYIENKTADITTSSVSAVSNSTLRDIAAKQIKNNSKLVQDLIDYLVQVNAHQIADKTGGQITFDTSTAQFKTTVGVIIPDQVSRARNLLDDLANFVNNRDWDDWDCKRKLNEYLSLIPRDFGRQKLSPREILPNLQKIQEENDILDGLDSSFAGLVQTSTTKNTDKEPEVFNVELTLISDNKIISRVRDKFHKTKKHGHRSVYSMDVKNVYQVDICTMRENYDKYGAKLSNIRQLWHGTKSSNVLSILRQGLIIPPAHSSHCTGRMYGSGAYFSSVSTKALNYATSFWGSGGSTKRIFMFLADVAMGNYHLASSGWGSSYPKKGYDSTWAKGGQSGVINDEQIIYKLSQANLVYLVEFKG